MIYLGIVLVGGKLLSQSTDIWASIQENLSSGFREQQRGRPATHLRSLISAIVIRLLQSFISILSTSEITIF